jgi:hypothetical protein
VIVAVPSATEVTRPVDATVATASSDVVHVTVALAIVAPFWSLTVADNWAVSPSEAKLTLVAERVIDVATGVGVGVGEVGLPSPPQLHKNSENNTEPNATVCFMPSFCPAPLRPATQDAQNSARCGWVPRRGATGVPTLCSSEVGYRPLIGRASNELIMSSLFHPPLTWTKAFAS